MDLLVHPAFSYRAEGERQTNSHFGADAGAAVQDAREGLAAHAQRPSGFRDGQSQRLQTEFAQYFARVRRVVINAPRSPGTRPVRGDVSSVPVGPRGAPRRRR